MQWFFRKARQIDASTPADRNRYADFLRTLAIAAVVFGHWLVAYIQVDLDLVFARTVLAEEPKTQWLTWVFQVMPLFFFVGGMVNALSWESATDRDEGWVHWVRRRSRRLLWPLIPLLVVWIFAAPAIDVFTETSYLARMAAFFAFLPVWFLAAYLCIVAISPAMYWLHRRFGTAVVVVMLAGIAVVDLFVNAGIQWVGGANFLLVWAAIHQLGFFWHDGRIPAKPLAGAALAVVGLAVAVWLTQVAGYPLTMVATGEPVRTNDYPPSLALMALAAAHIGIVAMVRDRVSAFLERPVPWAAVTAAGQRMMTIFLWHMPALVVVAALVYPTGLWPAREEIDLVWWLLRIPWLVLLAGVLAIFVVLFGRFERPAPMGGADEDNWWSRVSAAAGVMLVASGLTLIVTHGLYHGEGLVGLYWQPVVMVAVGFVALRVVDFRANR